MRIFTFMRPLYILNIVYLFCRRKPGPLVQSLIPSPGGKDNRLYRESCCKRERNDGRTQIRRRRAGKLKCRRSAGGGPGLVAWDLFL
ncbi:hypothetical protein D1AOALGA4SA_9185 [Olavius algarvensis Delta 1 endosymbiont]|nr:hypothetical protein D1AOALGA4SA_9185 [Olavius algarvensis Delta 1 endosymbiont]